MAGLCKENVVVSTLSPGSQTLTISQHLQENFIFFSSTASSMLVKPSRPAGDEELDQGWLHSGGFFSSALFHSFPRRAVRAGAGSAL